MEEADTVVVADISYSRIALLAARKEEGGRLNVLGVETDGTPKGYVRSGVIERPGDVAFKVRELVKKMGNRLGDKCRIVRVYVNMNGKSICSDNFSAYRNYGRQTQITHPEIVSIENEIRAQNSTGYDVLYVEPGRYVLDGERVANPMSKSCFNLEANYLAVMADGRLKSNIDKMFDRIQEPKMADYNIGILSTARAVLNDEDRAGGVLLLDFGAETTSMAVYCDGALSRLAVIPFGGAHVTADLCSLGLSEQEAEALKINHGCVVVPSDKQDTLLKLKGKTGQGERSFKIQDVQMVIKARIDEILSVVESELELSGCGENVHGAVITGGASRLQGLQEYLGERMGLTVRDAAWTGAVSTVAGSTDVMQQGFAPLIGLALWAKGNCVETEKDDEPEEETKAVEKKPEQHKTKKKGGFLSGLAGLFENESNIDDIDE